MFRAPRFFLILALLAGVARADEQLSGKRWNVSIKPERLAVQARLPDGRAVAISAAREADARVADLKLQGDRITWNLPDENIAVAMALTDDVLDVEFRATSPGQFTWPIVAHDQSIVAFILPMFEGLYVPTEGQAWATFLLNQSPLDTTTGLSMPFWGVDIIGGHTLTYIITNPYNNELEFTRTGERLGLKLTHEFTRNNVEKRFGFRIHLGDRSPVTPAKIYRQHLLQTDQFVSLKQKIERTPDAAKLLGAPHIYLWGDNLIARGDVKDYKALARRLPETPRIWDKFDEDARKVVRAIPDAEFVDNFQKGQVVEALARVLKTGDVTPAQLCEAFPGIFVEPPESWGDGLAPKMIDALATAGIDRAWLGAPGWDAMKHRPDVTRKAIAAGYLVGPYDSYHSIHVPGEADTWETAQFDQHLYDTGGIVKADGSKRKGFKQKGYVLSPAAARPHLEKRVTKLMSRFKCNSWFMDCDAFGEVFDDYSPDHPATQAEDARERVGRMAWIRDTFAAVIGSEGGSAYATAVIHFSHGVMTPVVAWGDPDLMKDKQSKFYLGGWWPPDAPAVFFKQVPMKDEHRLVYADPRFRLPLYQIVFHDSVVATHQWGYGSLKFDDPGRTRELLELLYNVPPLYHLNLAEWDKRKDHITAHHKFFAPLHREAGVLPMSDFRWLSDDRLVQRTSFGGTTVELVANFGDATYHGDGFDVPPHSVLAGSSHAPTTTTYP
jgi:hypothetical protein